MLTQREIDALYEKRVKRYDLSTSLYALLGFRMQAYRMQAIASFELKRGETVVDIGCGTGLSFPLIENEIGPDGHIIGIDRSAAMLTRARARTRAAGWSNVELVQADAEDFVFPRKVTAVFSAFAMTLVPEWETVIKRGSEAMTSGGRFVILDLKIPERWPPWLTRLGVFLARPFGVSVDLGKRHPWVALERYCRKVSVRELYGGCAYIAWAKN